jgi:hypothetical protein
MDRLQPYIQRNVTGLEHCPNLDGELALAGAAAIEPDPATLNRSNPILTMALRANRAIRPKAPLYFLMGKGFIVEVGGGKSGHDGISLTAFLPDHRVFVKYTIADPLGISAVDTHRPIGPDGAFQLRDRSGFIVENRDGENGHGQHLSVAAM